MNGSDCFVVGTRVHTPHGPAAIERLGPGDLVLAAGGPARVVATLGADVLDLIRIHFDDGSAVEATPWHRFVDVVGTLRRGRDLGHGVALRKRGGEVAHVTRVESLGTRRAHPVYNLALDRAATYYANGVLVEATQPAITLGRPITILPRASLSAPCP